MLTSRRRMLAALALTAVTSLASIAPAGAVSDQNVTPAPGATFPAAVEHGDPLASLAGAAYRALAWSSSWGAAASSLQYERLLDEVAAAVAERLEIPAEYVELAWADLDSERQLALLGGLSQVGVPYRRMSLIPGQGYDCSGFTSYAWSLAGLTIPRSSGDQIRASADRDAESALAGDLVYYPGHVMMSLGLPGAVVHSPQTGRVVDVQMLSDSRINRVQYGSPLG